METEKILLPPKPARDAQSPKGGFRNYGLFRSKDQRIIGGVAGGLGERFGVDPVLVRIAFALLSLSGLAGMVLYAVLWALMPESDGTTGPFLPPKTQRAVAMGMIVLGVMILLRPLGLWLGDTAASSLSLAALGAGVIWLSSPESKRQRWSRHLSERMPDNPLETLGAYDRVGRLRLGAGALFFGGGILLFLQRTNALEAAPGIVLAVVATMAGLGILFGPWGWRLLRQLTEERRERIRSEERAVLEAVHRDHPEIRFLALSVSDAAEDVIAVIRAGARGYVTKSISPADLSAAIRRVNEGDAVFSPRLAGFVLDAFGGEVAEPIDEELDLLTQREREVMRLIARGYAYKEVAKRLHLSVKTIETHVSAVLRKLQLSSRHELTRWATERRLV